MKKFIWVMLLAVTVMLNTSCEENAAETAVSANSTTSAYLESEGTSTHIPRTALDMSLHADEIKSGISTPHFKNRVPPKCSSRGRNNLGTMVVVLIGSVYTYNKQEEGKDKRGSKP
jgi:hypothetical protein